MTRGGEPHHTGVLRAINRIPRPGNSYASNSPLVSGGLYRLRMGGSTAAQAAELYAAHKQAIYRRTDRVFAILMLLQWVFGIIAAIVISPRTWSGTSSHVHQHVWSAVFLGGTISALPIER